MDSHVDDGQLNALLDGELDAAARGAVETHLAACAECRARYEEARRFLAQATDLLGSLDAPAVQAAGPAAASAPDARRVAPTAKEPAVTLAAPGVARTGKEPAVDPAMRVARTAKEKAVVVPPTTEVPALPPVLPTQQSPAVRPIFAQAQRGEPADEGRRRVWSVPPLAWAAMLVVGIGAGWMANEALRPPRPALDDAGGPPPAPAESASREDVAQAPPAAATAPSTRAPARQPLVKPRPMRGAKPPTADEAAARVPLDRPPGAARRSDELASSSAGAVAGPPAAASAGAGVRSSQTLGAAGGGAAPAPPATAPPEGAPLARRAAPAAAPARAAEAAATTFQRITMDEAVRRLSGSIRLIDGLQPGHVEVGPGRLVPGAAPDREVVRVYYHDEAGRPLVLDQQPGETPSAMSVNGLMRGDTLVTAQPEGATRVSWVDRKSFWLSLTGTGGADSVRMLVERIR